MLGTFNGLIYPLSIMTQLSSSISVLVKCVKPNYGNLLYDNYDYMLLPLKSKYWWYLLIYHCSEKILMRSGYFLHFTFSHGSVKL